MPQNKAVMAVRSAGVVNGAGGMINAAPCLVKRILREQWVIIVLAGSYLLVAYLMARANDQPYSLSLYGQKQFLILVNLGAACLVLRIARLILRERPKYPLRRVWSDWTGEFALAHRLAHAIPAFLLLPVVLSAFTSIKQTIPNTLGFTWDETFARWDAWLHGGTQPWILLQPLLGRPWITELVDYAYGPPWFWMMLAMQFWVLFSRDPRRLRLLLTFMLSWIVLGSLAATLFGSAGPVYYGRLVAGPDPFAPLIAYLHSVAGPDGLFATRAHAYLWEAYQSDFLGVGVGMSAMPSMHIAMACLFAIMAWPWHWTLRWLALGYLLVLQVGSVHLGWHYAIDGYVGIVGTLLIWTLTGRLAPDRPQGFGNVSGAPMRP